MLSTLGRPIVLNSTLFLTKIQLKFVNSETTKKKSTQLLLKTEKKSMAYLIQFTRYRVKTSRAYNSKHMFSF